MDADGVVDGLEAFAGLEVLAGMIPVPSSQVGLLIF